MSSSFPRFFVLKSLNNSMYVQHVKELEEHKDFLVCNGGDIGSLHSRFQVEESKKITSYFHIRCCYNNKYWAVDADGRIYAGEKEPVEDTDQPNCTLFHKVRSRNEEGTFGLVSSKVNQDVSFDKEYYSRDKPLLVLATPTPYCSRDFKAIDWESLVALPRYVAFKGDNGKYLQVANHTLLQYKADKRNYKSANFEIIKSPDGTIRLKNDGKFWRAGPNWIYCDAECEDTDYSDPATLFMPVRVKNNVIALRNMKNNYFCLRTTFDWHSDCLRAEEAGISISREAHFQLEEPVSKRKITDIRFRENDCRYYNESIVTMAKAFVNNNTHAEQQVEMELSYEHSSTHTWTTSYLSTFTIQMGFTFEIPEIIGVTFNSSTQNDKFYEWGQKRESVETLTKNATVTVQPGDKVQVQVVAKRRYCDVPFSYSREDTNDDGSHPNPDYNEDGVYTGIYCTDFHTQVEKV